MICGRENILFQVEKNRLFQITGCLYCTTPVTFLAAITITTATISITATKATTTTKAMYNGCNHLLRQPQRIRQLPVCDQPNPQRNGKFSRVKHLHILQMSACTWRGYGKQTHSYLSFTDNGKKWLRQDQSNTGWPEKAEISSNMRRPKANSGGMDTTIWEKSNSWSIYTETGRYSPPKTNIEAVQQFNYWKMVVMGVRDLWSETEPSQSKRKFVIKCSILNNSSLSMWVWWKGRE